MRRKALILVLVFSFTGADLFACGDKFLVASRGTRFQRGPEPGRGYAVVVFAPQTSPLAEHTKKEAAARALARAGYRPVAVDSAADLASRLAEARSGLVVASAGDAPSLESRVAPGRLVVVPAAAGTEALLDAVDAAMRRLVQGGVAASLKP